MPSAEIASPGESDIRYSKASHAQLLCSSSLGGGKIDFSIVVPAHNRPVGLGQCLQAIASQTYRATRFEVIVVDDGSEDSLEPVVAPFLGRLNISLRRQPNSGPAGARNTGAAAARGCYVVFTDDDCRPDPGWLGALASRLAANPGCAAGGQTVNGLPGNLFSSASQVLFDYLYRHWNRDADDALFIAANNLAFPRTRFLEGGGFDANFPLAAAEDRELCGRWRAQRGRIVFAPDAIVHHFHSLNLKTFLRQHFNYGCGAMIFRDVRRRRAEQRVRVEPRLYYLPLFKYAFSRDGGYRGVVVAMLVGLSQIVTPLGYLYQWYISRAETSTFSGHDRPRKRDQFNGGGEAARIRAMRVVRRLRYHLRVRAFDALNHPVVVPVLSSAFFILSSMLRPFLPAASLSLLCGSHRILMRVGPGAGFSGLLNTTIEQALIRACATDGLVESVASRSTNLPEVAPDLLRKAGIVLKAPRCEYDRIVEKGVLVLKNTERLDTFRRCVAMASLLQQYTLILEPSWSGYANPKMLSFCVFRDHPIVVMSPCRADHQFLERLNSNLRPIPTGASDWVDPRVFRPLDGQDKRFDAVMIARWTLVKRHHLELPPV